MRTGAPLPPSPLPDAADPDSDARLARFALLGHDLRAAVSDVLGGIRLIGQTPLDPHARLQLDRVRAAGEEMARLLEDGIALAAEHSGETDHHPVQAARFFREITQRWDGRARECGLALVLDLAADVPEILLIDRTAIERLLGNLLSNALKYTERGTVQVTVAAPAGLRITVEDDGPGFSPDVLDDLFAPGRRGVNAQNHPGHGLGMFIAQTMAQRTGGTIMAENRAAGGARVTVDLPLHLPPCAAGAEDLPDLSQRNVLLAEDSKLLQLVLGQMLAAMGAEHDVADDGVTARDMLDSGAYDLAIIDIEMPRMSGLALIEALRHGHDRHRDLPIVACTAYALRTNRDAILAAGADAILRKPVAAPEALGAAITRAMARNGAPEPEDLPLSTAPGAMPIERLLAARDPETVRPILTDLVSDLVAIERGLAAAQAGPDFARIATEAHKLLAISGTIGADRLETLADGLLALATAADGAGVRRALPRLMAKIDRLIQRAGNRLHALPKGGDT